MGFRKYFFILSTLLTLGIMYGVVNSVPPMPLYEPPMYNDSIWRGPVQEEYLTFRAVEGTLSFSKMATHREFPVGGGEIKILIVNSTGYALETGDGAYYLVSNNYIPVTDIRYQEYLDAPTVYIHGNFFNYGAPDGSILRMINPLEISVEPMVDVVAVSGKIISDIVGEPYFGRYFSKPVVWADEYSSSRRYEVEYDYSGASKGRYRRVILTFNEDKMLVDQEGIPDSGSRIPYRVSDDEARMLALESGFLGIENPGFYPDNRAKGGHDHV